MFDNFGYILERKRDIHPERTAIIDDASGRRYTYADLDSLANRTANALLGLKVKKGDRVLVVLDNSPEFFGLLFGCDKIGAILVPLNFRLAAEEIAGVGADVSPKVVICQPEYLAKVEVMKRRAKTQAAFFVLGRDDAHGDYGDFSELVAAQSDSSPGIASGGDDPSVILFTSGSSGKPKGVVQTHKNTFVKSVDQIVDLEPRHEDMLLTMAPTFHVGGLNILTMSMFHVGGSVVLLNRFEPMAALDIIQRRKVTLLFAIPTMLKMMMGADGWAKGDLSSLRYVVSGGEPVPERVKKAFEDKGVPVLAAYGLTEGSSMSSFLRVFDHQGKSPGCIGKPPTHLESKVVDEAGRELGEGQVGELLHRGPTVMPGYWGHPGETEMKIVDGWLHTGDLVFRDAQGFYYLVGRRDEMVKSGGEKVYPAEVEEAIFSHPKVAEVIVLGVPDSTWGHSVLAVVAPKADASLTEAEIISHCKEKIAGFKCPRKVILVPSLPHTGSGKVDRKKVRETYGGSG